MPRRATAFFLVPREAIDAPSDVSRVKQRSAASAVLSGFGDLSQTTLHGRRSMKPQNASTLFAPAGDYGTGGGVTQTGNALADTKNKITETARDAAAKLKSAASDTANKAKEHASRIATEKKETAANRLGGYSEAIRDSAKSMEEKDPNLAWFTQQAAEKLQGVADYVRSRDLNELRADAEGLARRHPAVFFGGMFLAGLLVGNVVKASRRKVDGPHRDLDRVGNDLTEASDRMGQDFDAQQELSPAERGAAGL
jgi:hypothetical protein